MTARGIPSSDYYAPGYNTTGDSRRGVNVEGNGHYYDDGGYGGGYADYDDGYYEDEYEDERYYDPSGGHGDYQLTYVYGDGDGDAGEEEPYEVSAGGDGAYDDYAPNPYAEMNASALDLKFNDYSAYVRPLKPMYMPTHEGQPQYDTEAAHGYRGGLEPLRPRRDHRGGDMRYHHQQQQQQSGQRQQQQQQQQLRRRPQEPFGGVEHYGSVVSSGRRQVYDSEQEKDTWKKMRRSPVESVGLAPIKSFQVDDPSLDGEELRKMREDELEVLDNGPKRTKAGYLDKTDVSGTATDINEVRQWHDRELDDFRHLVDKTGPKPEAIQCGWSEYQTGATYQDINRYREHEERELRKTVLAQQEEDVRYYL